MKPLFIFSSNSIRLSIKNWLIVLIIVILSFIFTPIIWQKLERFNPADEYRIPYELSNDYWMFYQWSKYASLKYPILIIGDSVIWGQYVSMNETLPFYLNELGKGKLFANLGVDGIHPVAMLNLVKYYGKSIYNKRVILHLNPLWLTSKKHDLSDVEEFRFNHPRLVPQFYPKIKSYRAKFPQKINVINERYIPMFGWINHVRFNYYENMDIKNWTMQYPYENPINAINFHVPFPENKPHSQPISWMERGMEKQDFPWVELGESFQWNSFKKVINLLKERKNLVFVIIGPFNPYILTNESYNRYNILKKEMADWLKNEGISYLLLSDLPANLYADASHPLKDGYKEIAKELYNSKVFKDWYNFN